MVRRYLDIPSAPAGLRAASPPVEQSPSRIPLPMRSAATDEPRQPASDTPKSEPVRATQTTTSALMSETAAEIRLRRSLFLDVKDFPITEFCRFEALSNHVCRRGFCRSTTRDQITRLEYVELSDAMKANMAASEARAKMLRARGESEFYAKGGKEIPKSLTGMMEPLKATSFSGCPGVSMGVGTDANRNMLSNPSRSKGPSMSMSVEFDAYKPIRPLIPTPKPTVPNKPFALQSELDRPQAELVRTMNTRESATLVVKTLNGWLEEDPSLIPSTLHLYNEDGSRVGPYSAWSPAQVSPGYQFAPSLGEWKRPRAAERREPWASRMTRADSSLASARAPGGIADPEFHGRDLESTAFASASGPSIPPTAIIRQFPWVALQASYPILPPTKSQPSKILHAGTSRERALQDLAPFCVNMNSSTIKAAVAGTCSSTVAKGKCKADAVDLRNEEMAQLRGRQPRLPASYARAFGGYNPNNNEYYFIDCRILGCLECTQAGRQQIPQAFNSARARTGAKSVTKAFNSVIASGEAQEGDSKDTKNENAGPSSYTRLKIRKHAALPLVAKSQWELIEASVARHRLHSQPFLERGTKRRAAEAAEKADIANLPTPPQELPSATPHAAVYVQEGPRRPCEEDEVEASTRARPFSTPQLALDLLTKEFVYEAPQGAERDGIQYAQSSCQFLYQSLLPPTQDTALLDEDALERARQAERDPTSGYSHFIYQFHSTVQDAPLLEEEDVWESCEEESKTLVKSLSTMKQDLELGVRKIALETAKRAERARASASSTQSPQPTTATQDATPPAPSQTPWKRKLVKFADEVETKDTEPKFPSPLSDRLAITYILIVVAFLITLFFTVLMVWAIAEMLCVSLHGVVSAVKRRVLKVAARLPERDVLVKKLGRYIRIAMISSAPIGFMAIAFATGFATRDYLSKSSGSGSAPAIPNIKAVLSEAVPSAVSNGPLPIIRCILGSLGFVLLVGCFSNTFFFITSSFSREKRTPAPRPSLWQPPAKQAPRTQEIHAPPESPQTSRIASISYLTSAALIIPALFFTTTPQTSRLAGIVSGGISILSAAASDSIVAMADKCRHYITSALQGIAIVTICLIWASTLLTFLPSRARAVTAGRLQDATPVETRRGRSPTPRPIHTTPTPVVEIEVDTPPHPSLPRRTLSIPGAILLEFFGLAVGMPRGRPRTTPVQDTPTPVAEAGAPVEANQRSILRRAPYGIGVVLLATVSCAVVEGCMMRMKR
jgi:hypothetical protein